VRQVSQIAISALVCKNVGTPAQPEMLLQYDSRVDCLSPEYMSYLIFAWVMALLWPIGCPFSLLLLLNGYNVPQIAARKLRAASMRAFLVHSLTKASEIGIDATELVTEVAPVGDSSASEAPQAPLEDTGRLGSRRSTGHSRRASRSSPERPFAGMRSYTSFEDMATPLLHVLCKAHGIDVTSPIKLLIEALAKRMDELLGSGEVVVPLVVWDDQSPDPEEQLALRRLEGLIGAYEVAQYRCARCISPLGLVRYSSGYSSARKCACTCNRFLDLAPSHYMSALGSRSSSSSASSS
jgi:hypothetical protein